MVSAEAGNSRAVEKAITATVGEVKSTKKLRSGDLLVEVHSRKQSEQIVKLTTFSNIPITVSPHSSLNSSKGVITCGELLNVPTEEILKELQGEGDIYTQPTPRFQVPTFLDIWKTSCRGTLTCARCAEVGHESTDCTRTEKCVNCKGEHTSFSRNCIAWKREKEIISTKIKKQISYPEPRRLVNSQTPTPGNSYVSVAKSFSAPSVQKNPVASVVTFPKPSDSTTKASPPITNLPIPSSPSVAPVSEEALASPDLTNFTLVTNKKKLKKDSTSKTNNTISTAVKISTSRKTSSREVTNPIPTTDNVSGPQSALKRFETTKPTYVDIELLPMAVLPPLEKRLLQSRESDADAEMSSSSASEEDALEYNMSEDLEDSPAVISAPPPSTPQGHIFFRCDGLHDPEVP
ncbi:hypothetical protein AVEN_156316-1 [Araneus ventricosus]|uniref:CCHC-type domain-containing protein n=1 Tax=Araneus ventricosus TaxID=182803 RepID=A0A4Y2L6D3_ARAVE|nr:hypothetical protein AVEN_156316-1 [Araneus ventricosus]